jgi:hypothetical protein
MIDSIIEALDENYKSTKLIEFKILNYEKDLNESELLQLKMKLSLLEQRNKQLKKLLSIYKGKQYEN